MGNVDNIDWLAVFKNYNPELVRAKVAELHAQIWVCEACGAENNIQDRECKHCDCVGEGCIRSGCHHGGEGNG